MKKRGVIITIMRGKKGVINEKLTKIKIYRNKKNKKVGV